MIHSIEPSRDFSSLTESEREALDRDVLDNYPYPLALSYRNCLEARDATIWLGICIKDLVSTLYQYLALLALHDYAHSEVRRDYRVFAALEAMITRPGPGKWLGFYRETRRHLEAEGAMSSIPKLYQFFDRHHCGKKGTRLSLMEDGGTIRQETLAALVTLRNRWAHSKNLDPEAAERIAETLRNVIRHLYRDLEFLKDCPLLLTGHGVDSIPLQGCLLPDIAADKNEPVEVLLGLPGKENSFTKLVLHRLARKNRPEVLLFEELMENKHAIYSSSFASVRVSLKEKEGTAIVQSLLDLIEKVRTEDEMLTLEDTTWERFQRRCNAFSFETYASFLESGKYDSRIYLPHEEMEMNWEAWWKSTSPIFMIDAPQGTGKSALACHWVAKLAGWLEEDRSADSQNDFNPHTVIFYEAQHLNAYPEAPQDLLSRALCETLQFKPDRSWADYLSKALRSAPSNARCLLVFDALNEFQTMPNGWSRTRLLEEILQLFDLIKRADPQGKRVRLLLPLRWEVFESDGYSYREFETFRSRQGKAREFFVPTGFDRLVFHLEPFPRPDLLYTKICGAGLGMSPRFSWESLPTSLREGLNNPLMLHLFLRTYDGCDHSELDVKNRTQFERSFVDRLLISKRGDSKEVKSEKRERMALMRSILREMVRKHSQFLVLDDEATEQRLQDQLYERSRLSESGVARVTPYESLRDTGILREDVVRFSAQSTPTSKPRITKRLTFTHEFLPHVLYDRMNELVLLESRAILIPVLVMSILWLALAIPTGLLLPFFPEYAANEARGILHISFAIAISMPLGAIILLRCPVWAGRILHKFHRRKDLLLQFEGSELQDSMLSSNRNLNLLLFVSLGAGIFGISSSDGQFFAVDSAIYFLLLGLPLGAVYVAIRTTFELLTALTSDRHTIFRSAAFGESFLLKLMVEILSLVILFLSVGLGNAAGIILVWGGEVSGPALAIGTILAVLFIAQTAGIAYLAFYPIIGFLLSRRALQRVFTGKDGRQSAEKARLRFIKVTLAIGWILLPLGCILVALNLPKSHIQFGSEKIGADQIVKGMGFSLMEDSWNIQVDGPLRTVDDRELALKDLQPLVEMIKATPDFYLPTNGYLKLTNTEVSDLSPLASITNLTQLVLVDNPYLSNYSALADCKSLEILKIKTDLTTSDFDFIAALTGLREISISYQQNGMAMNLDWVTDNLMRDHICFITFEGFDESAIRPEDVTSIDGIHALTRGMNRFVSQYTIQIRNTHISDLKPLLHIDNDTFMSVVLDKNPYLSDLTPLRNLRSLESLTLRGNDSVSDYRFLESLNNLKYLHLYHISEGEVEFIRKLTNLKGLTLYPRGNLNLDIVAHMEKLQFLDVGNVIDDLTPLENLDQLETLIIYNSTNSNYEPLLVLDNLEYIDLLNCSEVPHDIHSALTKKGVTLEIR